MNIPFTLANPTLNTDFLAGTETTGLTNLKGQRFQLYSQSICGYDTQILTI